MKKDLKKHFMKYFQEENIIGCSYSQIVFECLEDDQENSCPRRPQSSSGPLIVSLLFVIAALGGVVAYFATQKSPEKLSSEGEKKPTTAVVSATKKESKKEEKPKQTTPAQKTPDLPKKIPEKSKEEAYKDFLVELDAGIEKLNAGESMVTARQLKTLGPVQQAMAAEMMGRVEKTADGYLDDMQQLGRIFNMKTFVTRQCLRIAREDPGFNEYMGVIWMPKTELATVNGYMEIMQRWVLSGPAEQSAALDTIRTIRLNGLGDFFAPELLRRVKFFGADHYLESVANGKK